MDKKQGQFMETAGMIYNIAPDYFMKWYLPDSFGAKVMEFNEAFFKLKRELLEVIREYWDVDHDQIYNEKRI